MIPIKIAIEDIKKIMSSRNPLSNISVLDDSDDDCILIPQHIEMIDLTGVDVQPQQPTTPVNFIPTTSAFGGVSLNNVFTALASTVGATTTNAVGAVTSIANAAASPMTDNSLLAIECAICLDSVRDSQPVSTICGHLFCKPCLQASFRVKKECPLCKKKLTRNSFHDIYLG